MDGVVVIGEGEKDIGDSFCVGFGEKVKDFVDDRLANSVEVSGVKDAFMAKSIHFVSHGYFFLIGGVAYFVR
jgi:hypothetical protein